MKLFVIYEELWGNYCYETDVIKPGEVQLSYGPRVHKIYNNLNERIADCQKLEEGPKWKYSDGSIGCNYHDYTSELKPSKVIWHYKEIYIDNVEKAKRKYYYTFETEQEAKECCYILNEAEKYLGVESQEVINHPKKYIKVPFYYCEGNQIIEEIPRTQFEVQKLFVYTKNNLSDFKPTIIKSVLKWGWKNTEFQNLKGKEYLKKVLKQEDQSVAQKRKELEKQYEIKKQNEPFYIDYITFQNSNETNKNKENNSYKFNKKNWNDLLSISSCDVKIQKCGNKGTFGYPDELKGQFALFIPITENTYQYTNTIPGTNKKYVFYEMLKYNLEIFYECTLLDYEMTKERNKEKNKDNQKIIERLENIIEYLTKTIIISDKDFNTLYKPCHMNEVFPNLTGKEIELLLSNPQSASVIAERDYLRKMLGDPTFE